MERTRVVCGCVLAALALAAGCGGNGDDDEAATTPPGDETSQEAGTALQGRTGPGFEIELTTADGQPVVDLAAGEYEIVVEDLSSLHNFHLSGPGVDESTTVEGEGTETFEVAFEAGTYTFVCDAHPTAMRGSFEVG